MKGFRDFLLKSNLVQVAVAFVMGTVFAALVLAFVDAFVTPSIGLAVGGKGNFAKSGFRIDGVLYPWGEFISALITFLIVAAVLYFAVLVPFTRLMNRYGHGDKPMKDCPECLSSIPEAASRCMYCTSAQPPAASPTLPTG